MVIFSKVFWEWLLVVEFLIFVDTQSVLMHDKLVSIKKFDFLGPNNEAIANNTHRIFVPTFFVSENSSMKYFQCFHLTFINCVIIWLTISMSVRSVILAVTSEFPTFAP